MRLCLLGEYSGNLDEGMRAVSFHFAEELSNRHQVLTLDLRDVFTTGFWKSIRIFNPQIIHYIHGPSLKSFILLKVISRYCREAKTVMSAMHHGISFLFLSAHFIKLFKPDIVLVQSSETEARLKKCGCETEFLGCGVDVQKFKPVTTEFRDGLRDKYGIDKDKFVILHVGSLKKGRNIQLMEKLQNENDQVIIVGAVSTGIEKNLIHSVEKVGCFVWPKYFNNVEDIYALSDCYVFPTQPSNKLNSIEMPLSVLEAMSCNLAVLATKFGALARVFEEGEGLLYVNNEEDLSDALEKIKKSDMDFKTREKVLPYAWDTVAKRLEGIYAGLIAMEE